MRGAGEGNDRRGNKAEKGGVRKKMREGGRQEERWWRKGHSIREE